MRNLELGMRNLELGIENEELGMRNWECGIGNESFIIFDICFAPKLCKESLKTWFGRRSSDRSKPDPKVVFAVNT